MIYDIAYATNKGGKKINEDSILIKRFQDGIVVCVADGLGSHGGGDIASNAVVTTFEACLTERNYIDDEIIKECFRQANNKVISLQTPQTPMKSTAVLLVIQNGLAKLAHIGDSRGYMFSEHKIVKQTLDHSIPQMAVFRGDISVAEIRFHKNRNQIIRALGVDGNVEITQLQRPKIKDAFLLCSDGFWEYVIEDEMEIDLLKSENAEKWLSYMLTRLGARVEVDHDNISAIAVILSE